MSFELINSIIRANFDGKAQSTIKNTFPRRQRNNISTTIVLKSTQLIKRGISLTKVG